MSRFIDKLKQTSRAMPQPMGFRVVSPASPKPRMQIVASMVEADIDHLADYVAGTDAGLLQLTKSSRGVKALAKVAQALSGIPWGVIGNDGGGGLAPAVKAGGDFIVFSESAVFLPIANIDKAGKILEVVTSLNDSMLRAIAELPVDAVLIGSEKRESLTWHHLMLFQRFANILSKPVLARVPSNLSGNEIESLWAVGVDAVVIEVGAEQPVARLSELRQVIDGLTLPLRHRRGKEAAILPRAGAAMETVTDEEEEE